MISQTTICTGTDQHAIVSFTEVSTSGCIYLVLTPKQRGPVLYWHQGLTLLVKVTKWGRRSTGGPEKAASQGESGVGKTPFAREEDDQVTQLDWPRPGRSQELGKEHPYGLQESLLPHGSPASGPVPFSISLVHSSSGLVFRPTRFSPPPDSVCHAEIHWLICWTYFAFWDEAHLYSVQFMVMNLISKYSIENFFKYV